MIRFSLLLILGLSLCSAVHAQQQAVATDDAHAADRAALRELGARYEQAINGGDLRPLASSVAPEASAVFATNDEVHGLDAMQKFFDSIKERLGKGSGYTVKLIPDRTEFFGDIAVAHGTSDETATLGNGREFRFLTHWTAVLRKTPEGWIAQRLHVSMNPFENPAIDARLQMRTWIVGGAGALLAALGYFLGRRVAKRAR